MKPYLVKSIARGDQVETFSPTVVRQVIRPATARTLTTMLVDVVDQQGEFGPVRFARIPGYSVAGKTGTAQIPTPQGYSNNATIASFVGYVPAEAPRFVILVRIDRPQ